MKTLQNATLKDLENEIIRRKKVEEVINSIDLLENPDTTNLNFLLKKYVKDYKNMCDDNDYEHYIFEECMQTFYGKDIFSKLNKIRK